MFIAQESRKYSLLRSVTSKTFRPYGAYETEDVDAINISPPNGVFKAKKSKQKL